MARREYLVLQRAGQWWVSLEGDQRGPHASRQIAVDFAIVAAKLDARAGKPSRVSVDEPGDGVPVVFVSDET